jgi:hypothetical protein
MPWVAGYEEDELLRSLGITIQDIAPLANNCTEVRLYETMQIIHVHSPVEYSNTYRFKP